MQEPRIDYTYRCLGDVKSCTKAGECRQEYGSLICVGKHGCVY